MNKDNERIMYWEGGLVFNLQEKLVFYESSVDFSFILIQKEKINSAKFREEIKKKLASLLRMNVVHFQRKYQEIQSFISNNIQIDVDEGDDIYAQEKKINSPEELKSTVELYKCIKNKIRDPFEIKKIQKTDLEFGLSYNISSV